MELGVIQWRWQRLSREGALRLISSLWPGKRGSEAGVEERSFRGRETTCPYGVGTTGSVGLALSREGPQGKDILGQKRRRGEEHNLSWELQVTAFGVGSPYLRRGSRGSGRNAGWVYITDRFRWQVRESRLRYHVLSILCQKEYAKTFGLHISCWEILAFIINFSLNIFRPEYSSPPATHPSPASLWLWNTWLNFAINVCFHLSGFSPLWLKKSTKMKILKKTQTHTKENLTEKPLLLWDGTVKFCLEFTSSFKLSDPRCVFSN